MRDGLTGAVKRSYTEMMLTAGDRAVSSTNARSQFYF